MTVLSDFLSSFSKSARTGLIAGSVLILLAMAAALWWVFSPSYQLLFGNLKETDAADVTKALAEWKVPYRFSSDGTAIEVPSDQVYDTRMKLVSAGVPSGGHVGFELFNDADFGVTEFAQRVNYQRAIQGELERSIATLPGVQAVRVHLTIRRPGLFVGQDDTSKASVTVGLQPGGAITPQQVGGIRNLVASAVEGLTPNAVVVLGPSGVLQGGASASSQDGLMAQNEEQSGYEGRVQERISNMLSQVFHLQSFRVSVDARMNFDKVHKVSERLISQGQDGNGLLVRKRTSKTGGGVATENTTAQTQQDEFDYAHGTEREEISRATGQVERLSVAVLVPPSLNASEMERLRKLVFVAAGLDLERGDRLEISAVNTGTKDSGTLENNLLLNPNESFDAAQPEALPSKSVKFDMPWMVLVAVAVGFLIVGWMLALLFRSAPKKLRPEERDAVLLKLRSWLAEDGAKA
ncbi:MAG: flagellar basal-body MS-ring/collar protein FliF [Arenimonas sp.]